MPVPKSEQPLRDAFEAETERYGHQGQHRYLHLLLLTLLLEVLGVLASSHSLKFRSNTHRKGSLLINN